jgi:hypothetical protein
MARLRPCATDPQCVNGMSTRLKRYLFSGRPVEADRSPEWLSTLQTVVGYKTPAITMNLLLSILLIYTGTTCPTTCLPSHGQAPFGRNRSPPALLADISTALCPIAAAAGADSEAQHHSTACRRGDHRRHGQRDGNESPPSAASRRSASPRSGGGDRPTGLFPPAGILDDGTRRGKPAAPRQGRICSTPRQPSLASQAAAPRFARTGRSSRPAEPHRPRCCDGSAASEGLPAAPGSSKVNSFRGRVTLSETESLKPEGIISQHGSSFRLRTKPNIYGLDARRLLRTVSRRMEPTPLSRAE